MKILPLFSLCLSFLFFRTTFSHSMMSCAVKSGNQCVGYPRKSDMSLLVTNYRFDGTNPCQPEARGVSNLASKYSPQCTSCGPMGTVQAGSKFTVEWKARNHAVAVQRPGNVKVFMAGPIQNGQTNDFTSAQFMQNKICEGPYTNCGKGANVDTTGDDVSCTLDCQMPNVGPGTYSIWWYWDWTINDGNIYATCADLSVAGGNGRPATSNPPLRTSQPAQPTIRTSQPAQPTIKTSQPVQPTFRRTRTRAHHTRFGAQEITDYTYTEYEDETDVTDATESMINSTTAEDLSSAFGMFLSLTSALPLIALYLLLAL